MNPQSNKGSQSHRGAHSAHRSNSGASHSSGSRNFHASMPSYRGSRGYSSGNRGVSRGNSRGGKRGGGMGEYIDVSRFINKATITEEVDIFIPEHKFSDFAVDERLKKSVATKGYVNPTPIQDRIIPHILRGEDVVGIANTGTGKTAAFLIPLINKVLKAQDDNRGNKENILIMAPTRELAIQIDQELKGFTGATAARGGLKIFSVCVVGGAPIGPQIRELRYHNNFVIGTPGRIKDLIERGVLNMAFFNTVVLDEADRMLDMGFINDMKLIMGKMPPMPPAGTRHTLFFSATMSKEIEHLIHSFLHNPARISVKTRDTSKDVEQDVVRVPPGKMKPDVLLDLLKQPGFDKVIIFMRTKHGAEKLAKVLAQGGIKSDSIHGDKTHGSRQKALGFFKQGAVQALVATDVAARGLDISGITHVINFDLPATYDDYVHRIGRTGRGGKKGKALTFV